MPTMRQRRDPLDVAPVRQTFAFSQDEVKERLPSVVSCRAWDGKE